MKDLIGHARELGFEDLAEVFRDAFDPDVRNSVAHADYILWNDGMRLRRRNGGIPTVIPWPELNLIVSRGIQLFPLVQHLVNEYIRTYDPPKVIRTRLHESEPESDYTLYFDPEKGALGFSTGGEPGKIP